MVYKKIHVLRLVLFVRRQFQRWWSISNTTLGPSGHGKEPPSSRLGTLYSAYWGWVMIEIHVLRLVLFVRRQFKRTGSISNTTLRPSGHGRKPPSSRLGTLYSSYRQCFITKIHVFRLVCLSDVNWNVGGRFQTPYWDPGAMVRSHHRRGWGPCTAIIDNCIWQKSMYLAWFCLSDVNWSVGVDFKHHTGPQWLW